MTASDLPVTPRRKLGRFSRVIIWISVGFEEDDALALIQCYEVSLDQADKKYPPATAELIIVCDIILGAVMRAVAWIGAAFFGKPSGSRDRTSSE